MAKIHFLNVGEGDCAIIEHDSRRISVIDICNGNGYHAEKTNPINYLNENLITNHIFRFILTHPDMDHMDGIENLVNNFNISFFWDTDNQKTMDQKKWENNKRYKKEDWNCYELLRSEKIQKPKVLRIRRGEVNDFWKQDGIEIISPSKEIIRKTQKTGKWNNISYVLLLTIRGKKILFCGDSEHDAWVDILGEDNFEETLKEQKNSNLNLKEQTRIANIPDMREKLQNIDILFAPHHGRGSGGNASNTYLNILKPKLAILGSAPSDDKNYPAFNGKKIPLLTNDEAGDITFEFIGDRIKLTCSKRTLEEILESKNLGSDYEQAWKKTIADLKIYEEQ